MREAGERSADDELVELGDDIRSLDLDTSMPNAPRAALAEYEQAIARYDQANELLSGDPTEALAWIVQAPASFVGAGQPTCCCATASPDVPASDATITAAHAGPMRVRNAMTT